MKPGNNHHIALYRDESGKIMENVVTFWNAVERKKFGVPVVITDPAATFDSLPSDLPDSFVSQLPQPNWTFEISIQSNEMFVLGMDEDDYDYAVKNNDNAELSKYIYRVQKIASKYYVFRHHLETSVDDKYNGIKNEKLSQKLGKFIRTRSFNAFFALNPHKIRIDNTGNIRYD